MFHMGMHILIIYIVLKKYVYLYVSVRGMCTSMRCPQRAVASDPLELQARCTGHGCLKLNSGPLKAVYAWNC